MASCRRIRPILPRLVEGEISPAESLRVGRHLPGCTACRILLARERRLAQVLAAMDDGLPVGGEFAAGVMGALPAGPPPVPAEGPARRRRNGLRIAGVAGAVGLGLGALTQVLGPGVASGPLPGLPRFEFEGLESLAQLLGGLVRLLFLTLVRLSAVLRLDLPDWGGTPRLVALSVPVGLVALLALSAAAAALATGRGGAQVIPRTVMRLLSAAVERPRRFAAAGRSSRSSASTRRM